MDLSGLGIQDTPENREKAEAILNMQKTVQSHSMTLKMLKVCFEKCVATPGESLSNTQQNCIWNCAQRNIETQYFILKRLQGMAQNLKPS